jgi:hypothetical protein
MLLGFDYPRGVVKFSQDAVAHHPTQKPVALMEYLIRTYTNEGDTVLDNCMAAGPPASLVQTRGAGSSVWSATLPTSKSQTTASQRRMPSRRRRRSRTCSLPPNLSLAR